MMAVSAPTAGSFELPPDGTPHLISLNLKRRHLDSGQRGAVATSLANLKSGQKKQAAQICAPVSQDDAADMFQVSRRSVQTATKAKREAPPEVFEAVKSGALSLNLKRRHLTEAQRGAVAAELANMPQGYRRDIERSANLQKVAVSQAEAAELLNVSTRSLCTAAKIEREAEAGNGVRAMIAGCDSGAKGKSSKVETII